MSPIPEHGKMPFSESLTLAFSGACKPQICTGHSNVRYLRVAVEDCNILQINSPDICPCTTCSAMKLTLCAERLSSWEKLVSVWECSIMAGRARQDGEAIVCSRTNPDTETDYIKSHTVRAAGLIFSGTFMELPDSSVLDVRQAGAWGTIVPMREVDTPVMPDRVGLL